MTSVPPERLPDREAVAADEALLAAVADGLPVDDDEVGTLLCELRSALDSEYAGHVDRIGGRGNVTAAVVPVITPTALSTKGGRRLRVTRRAVAIGATAALALSAGGVAAAYEAAPGSALWPLHRALIGSAGHGEATTALAKARSSVGRAAAAVTGAERAGVLNATRRASVARLIDAAAAEVDRLPRTAAERALTSEIAELRARLALVPAFDRHGSGPSDDGSVSDRRGSAGATSGEDRSGRSGSGRDDASSGSGRSGDRSPEGSGDTGRHVGDSSGRTSSEDHSGKASGGDDSGRDSSGQESSHAGSGGRSGGGDGSGG